jgi:ketosteroid isomerase-like protein
MFTRRQTVGMSVITMLGALAKPTFAAAADSQVDANKKNAERYVSEVWGQGTLEALDELVAEDFTPDNPEAAPGRLALRARIRSARQAIRVVFENVQYTIANVIGEGDKVVVRGFITGEAKGRKGKALYFTQLDFKDGLIVRETALVDDDALLRALDRP